MQRLVTSLGLLLALALFAGCGDVIAKPSPGSESDAGTPAPLPPRLMTITPSMGPVAGGTLVALIGKDFLPGMIATFDGQTATNITVHSPSVLTAITPPHAAGKVDVKVIGPGGDSSDIPDGFEYVKPNPFSDSEGRPRVVGAVSTGNTSVRVTFTEQVKDGAEDPKNYVIVQKNVNPESGALPVREAKLDTSGVSVTLTTGSQNEVVYEITVSNVLDLGGNPLAPPELLVNPTTAEFAGTPTSDEVDTDKDGLADGAEQSGWTVSVVLANGDIAQTTHTSDPTLGDTDKDGVSDGDEYAHGSNPRAADTDGDGITDKDEINVWRSSPYMQDTDGDGFVDGVELKFATSPILDDSDGDGVDDRTELLLLSRDPLLADLPIPQIVVQSVSLNLEVKSSYTDDQGVVQSTSDTTSNQFVQSRSQSESRSDTRSTESANKNSQEVGGEVSYGTKDGFGGKISAKFGFEQSNSRGFSSTVDTQSASQSQQSYDHSVSSALEKSERRSVSRAIENASILANVNLANQSNVAFTLKNVEISVQAQDRSGDGSFRPVATLRPSGGADLSFNLGPFDSERGPVIFENTDIFPNLVEQLSREPNGLIFKVANYDVLDEQGKNFAFSNAITKQRTVGISIDFGDGTVESYRVATHSKFDDKGRPEGISMMRALEIAGLALQPNDTPLSGALTDAQRSSYGTLRDTTGVERLVRVRGSQNDLSSTVNAEKRFWAIQTNDTDVVPDSDFSTLILHAGDEYLLYFTRDIDKDGLHEREEMMYGSLDTKPDTDNDGLLDIDEVRKGWTVAPLPGQPYKVFPSPSRPDSDLDGLTDAEEMANATDPHRSDTDSDAMLDLDELTGTFTISLFDGDADDTNNPRLTVDPYSDDAIHDGGNGVCNTIASGDDVQVVANGAAVAAGGLVIAPGPNGMIDTTPGSDDMHVQTEHIAVGPDAVCNTTASGDDVQITVPGGNTASGTPCVGPGLNGVIDSVTSGDDFVRVVHEALFAIHPTRQDTDFDGIPDGRELLIGTNPNSQDVGNVTDTDHDGLYDAEEDKGWYVAAQNTIVKSSKYFADTDQDGLLDVYEWAISSNPGRTDTDGDTLRDGDEFDPDDTDGYYSANNLATADRRCASSSSCVPATPPALANRLRTNVLATDSDGDTLSDLFEVNAGKMGASNWPVSVVGRSPYQAVPKPWSADFDLDGANDATELGWKTDPNLADTDADVQSGVSGGDNYEKGVGRNPLQPDMKVTLSYNNLIQHDICGDAGSSAEWYGNLYYTPPGGSATNLYACNDCCTIDTSGSCGLNVSATFFLNQGQTFSISSDQWYEYDTSSGNDDVGNFNQSFSYPATAASSTSIDISGGSDCPSSLSVTYSISLQ